MTNYTYEQRKMIAEFLEEMIKDEEVFLFDREDDGERFSLGECVNAIPSDDILRVIKQLKTVTFGDIKNQVGTKFKNEIFGKQVLIISKDTHNNPRIYNLSKAMILDKYFSLSNDAQVEVINETETN